MMSNRAGDPRRGGALMVIGIVVLCLAGLALAGLVAGGFFLAENVQVTRKGDTVAVETPIGSLRVRENPRLDPAKMGLPVYPNAQLEKDGGGGVELDFDGETAGLNVAVAHYSTADSLATVQEFFSRRLPDWEKKHRRRSIHFESGSGAAKRLVVVKERDGRTHISIVAIGDEAAVN